MQAIPDYLQGYVSEGSRLWHCVWKARRGNHRHGRPTPDAVWARVDYTEEGQEDAAPGFYIRCLYDKQGPQGPRMSIVLAEEGNNHDHPEMGNSTEALRAVASLMTDSEAEALAGMTARNARKGLMPQVGAPGAKKPHKRRDAGGPL